MPVCVSPAVAAILGSLAAIGVFDDDDGPGPTTLPPSSTVTVTAPPPSAGDPAEPEATPTPERTTVELVYPGDLDGCLLAISVAIGDQTTLPTGNRHVMTGVATGAQSYAIGGTIGCPTLGQCQATGGGVVDVAPGRSFEVQWQNTAFAMCEVVLVG